MRAFVAKARAELAVERGRRGGDVLGSCPVCDGDLAMVERRTLAARAWVWFNDGPPVWRVRFQCAQCDFSGTDRAFSNLYRSAASWGMLQRWRQFQFSRRFFPVPRFYAILTLTGAVTGMGLQLTFGWPWWWSAMLLPIAGWLWAASSASAGPEVPLARGRDLATDYRLGERAEGVPHRLLQPGLVPRPSRRVRARQ